MLVVQTMLEVRGHRRGIEHRRCVGGLGLREGPDALGVAQKGRVPHSFCLPRESGLQQSRCVRAECVATSRAEALFVESLLSQVARVARTFQAFPVEMLRLQDSEAIQRACTAMLQNNLYAHTSVCGGNPDGGSSWMAAEELGALQGVSSILASG